MTTVRLLLAGLLAAFGLVVVTPVASQACSCVGGDLADFAERSDATFSGTLVEVVEPPERAIVSSDDPVTYVFEVDRIYAGEVQATAEVTSARFGASCGLEGMRVGVSYVVFADAAADELSTTLCSGTGRARPAVVDRVERVLGTGDAPSPPPVLAGLTVLLRWLGWG